MFRRFTQSLLMCLGLFLFSEVNAQYKFSQLIYNGGSELAAVSDGNYRIGDVNQDGYNDLLVLRDNLLRTLINDGQNQLFLSNVENYEDGLTNFQLADLNGDDYPDILGVAKTTNSMFLQANLQDGTFGARVTITTITDNVVLLPADYNADGKIDIAYRLADEVFLMLNQGNGSFDVPNLVASLPATKLIAGDLNNDGYTDLAFSNGYFLNNQDATFSQIEIEIDTALHQNSLNFSLADVNGDDLLDIVNIYGQYTEDNQYQSYVLAHTNASENPFLNSSVIFSKIVPSISNKIRKVLFCDVDDDGDIDLVTDNSSLYFNESGNYQFANRVYQEYFTELTFADMDGDDVEELLIFVNDKLIAYQKNALVNIESQANLISSAYSGKGFLLADIDGDLLPEMLTTLSSEFLALDNNGSGEFSIAQNIRPNFDYGFIEPIKAGTSEVKDFAYKSSQGDLKLLLKQSSEYIDKYLPISLKILNQVSTADVNNDGNEDLVIRGYNIGEQSSLTWIDNNDFNQLLNYQNEIISGGFNDELVDYKDIDNDGDVDIVLGRSEQILAYFNDGNGNFGSSQEIVNLGFSDAPERIVVEDFNGDGNLDVAYNVMFEELAIIFGNGNGTFSETPLQLADDVFYFAAGDGDADGDLDLSFNLTEQSIQYLENDGSGNFSNQTTLHSSAQRINTMEMADLDNNGVTEVLFIQNDSLEILFNAATSSKFFMPRFMQYNGLRTLDIDNDSDLDVILSLATSSGRQFTLMSENFGNGNLGAFDTIFNFEQGGLTDFVDINKDNLPDVILEKGYSGCLALLNDGNYNYVERIVLGPGQAKAAFIDSDDDIDIFYAENNFLKWKKNLGNANFNIDQSLVELTQNNEWILLEQKVGDVNSDGLEDLLMLYRNEARSEYVFRLLAQKVTGGFESQVDIATISNTEYGEAVDDIQLADLEADGDIDIFFIKNRTLHIFENNGGIEFSTSSRVLSEIDFYGNYALSDFDKDGLMDVVFWKGDGMFWLKNSINQTFETIKIDPLVNSQIATEDVDQDGYDDIIAATQNKLYWYKNFNGAFRLENEVESTTLLSGATNPAMYRPLTLIDNYQTNRKDIFTSGTSQFVVAENNGQSFTAVPKAIGSAVKYSNVSNLAKDITGDGYVDIITTGILNRTAIIYINDGSNQSFTPVTITASNFYFAELLDVADFDQNGLPDLLFAQGLEKKLSILYQNSEGILDVRAVDDDLEVNANNYAIRDLNEDGYPDLVVQINSSIRYFRNKADKSFASPRVLSQPRRFDNKLPTEFHFKTADLDNDGKEEFIGLLTFRRTESCDPFWGCSFEYKYVTTINQFNEGSGKMERLLLFNELLGNNQSKFVDINLDGKSDMLNIQSDGGSNDIYVRYQLENLEFAPAKKIVSLNNYSGYIINYLVYDFDADGIMEFVVNSENKIVVYDLSDTTDQDGDGVTYFNDCDDNNSAILDTLPQPDIDEVVYGCTGKELTIAPSNPSTSYNYFWSGPNNFSSSEPQLYTESASPANNGDLSLIFSTESCVSEIAQFSIEVNDTPNVSLTLNNNQLEAISDDNIVYYLWYKDGVLLEQTTTPFFTATSDGVYCVLVQDDKGCQSKSELVDVVLTSISYELAAQIQLSPNPVREILTIQVPLKQSGNYHLFGVNGQVVLSGQISDNQFQIPVHHLEKGIYMLRITIDGEQVNRKVSVQ